MEEKPAQWVKDGPAWKKLESQESGLDDLGSTTLDRASEGSASPQSIDSEHRLQCFLPARVEEGDQSGSIERTNQSRERISESMLREYRGLTIRLWEAGDDETASGRNPEDDVRDPGRSLDFEDPIPANFNHQSGEKQRVKVHIERQSPESKARAASSVAHEDAIEAINMLQRAIRSSPQPRAARDSMSSGDLSNGVFSERTTLNADQENSSLQSPFSTFDQLNVPPMPPSPLSSQPLSQQPPQPLPLQPPQSEPEPTLSPRTPPRAKPSPLNSGGSSVESATNISIDQPAAPHNAKNSSGATPLHLVAATGSLPGLKLLIGHGAHLDAQDTHGRSTLHVLLAGALQDPLLHIVALLDAGANPNLGDGAGCTPLHMAAECGNAACVRALLAAGAESVPTTTGDTPLHLAAQGGHLDVMQALVSGDFTDEATKAAAQREESNRREAEEREEANRREEVKKSLAEEREAAERLEAAKKRDAVERIASEVLHEAQQMTMGEIAGEVVQQVCVGTGATVTMGRAPDVEVAASTVELKLAKEVVSDPKTTQLRSSSHGEAEVEAQSHLATKEVDAVLPENDSGKKRAWKSATSPRSRFRERSLQRAALGSAHYLADILSSTEASDATDEMSEASSTPTTATSSAGAALDSQSMVSAALVNSFAPGHNYMSYSSDDEPFMAMEEPGRWLRYESEQGEYYYNPNSGESQWDPPTGAAVIEEPSHGEAFTEINEAADGGEAAWTDYESSDAYVDEADTEGTNDDEWPAESAWEAFVDEASGATYYYNWTTEETSWEYPLEDEEYTEDAGDGNVEASAEATDGFGNVDVDSNVLTAEEIGEIDAETITVAAEETRGADVDRAPEGLSRDGEATISAEKESVSIEPSADSQDQLSSSSSSEESRSLQVWNKFFEAALTRVGDIEKAAEAAAAADALLLNAVMAGDLETVEQLILRGVPAVCVDTQGRTPLHYASYNGNREVSTRRQESFSTLSACACSRLDVADPYMCVRVPQMAALLCDFDAAVQAIDSSGNTVISLCVVASSY